jgi:hypothetical protein
MRLHAVAMQSAQSAQVAASAQAARSVQVVMTEVSAPSVVADRVVTQDVDSHHDVTIAAQSVWSAQSVVRARVVTPSVASHHDVTRSLVHTPSTTLIVSQARFA